jgi:hypothetical protein
MDCDMRASKLRFLVCQPRFLPVTSMHTGNNGQNSWDFGIAAVDTASTSTKISFGSNHQYNLIQTIQRCCKSGFRTRLFSTRTL